MLEFGSSKHHLYNVTWVFHHALVLVVCDSGGLTMELLLDPPTTYALQCKPVILSQPGTTKVGGVQGREHPKLERSYSQSLRTNFQKWLRKLR